MPSKKILIVEDEILIAEDLRLVLQRLGYQVVGIASSGIEAIQKAGKLYPDLVLMDVRLQGSLDGVETARQIRKAVDIPIIYVTAYASVLASLDLEEGCTRLAKPFSPLQLQAAIECAFDHSQKQAQ